MISPKVTTRLFMVRPSLFLHQVDSKAPKVSLQVDRLCPPLGIGLTGGVVNRHPAALQMIDGPLHTVGTDGDVSVDALVHSTAVPAWLELFPARKGRPNRPQMVLAVRSDAWASKQLMPTWARLKPSMVSTASRVKRVISAQFSASMRSFFTIQVPPQATTWSKDR